MERLEKLDEIFELDSDQECDLRPIDSDDSDDDFSQDLVQRLQRFESQRPSSKRRADTKAAPEDEFERAVNAELSASLAAHCRRLAPRLVTDRALPAPPGRALPAPPDRTLPAPPGGRGGDTARPSAALASAASASDTSATPASDAQKKQEQQKKEEPEYYDDVYFDSDDDSAPEDAAETPAAAAERPAAAAERPAAAAGRPAAPAGRPAAPAGRPAAPAAEAPTAADVDTTMASDSDTADGSSGGPAGGGGGAPAANPSSKRSERRRRRRRPVLSNDQLLYDPELDEQDQQWVDRQRRRYQPDAASTHGSGAGHLQSQPKKLPHSDAVLNCPACMTMLCLDCQRHELYSNQYRAMFVFNCDVDSTQALRYRLKEPPKRRGRRGGGGGEPNGRQSPTDDAQELFNPVKCATCKTEVAVCDSDELYHFFNVIASHS